MNLTDVWLSHGKHYGWISSTCKQRTDKIALKVTRLYELTSRLLSTCLVFQVCRIWNLNSNMSWPHEYAKVSISHGWKSKYSLAMTRMLSGVISLDNLLSSFIAKSPEVWKLKRHKICSDLFRDTYSLSLFVLETKQWKISLKFRKNCFNACTLILIC